MSVRTHATFDADFPEDGEWDSNGAAIRPNGEAVTTAIHAGLSDRGIRCSSVQQRGFYGWEFDYNVEGVGFICVV